MTSYEIVAVLAVLMLASIPLILIIDRLLHPPLKSGGKFIPPNLARGKEPPDGVRDFNSNRQWDGPRSGGDEHEHDEDWR